MYPMYPMRCFVASPFNGQIDSWPNPIALQPSAEPSYLLVLVLLWTSVGWAFIVHIRWPSSEHLNSLAQIVFEILCSKPTGVMSLTFQGHVTSSVMWSFDSPYAVSYWWSFGTKPLSLTVSEIFNVKCNAMVDELDMTLIRPLNEGQGHSFWYQSISHIRLPIGYQ